MDTQIACQAEYTRYQRYTRNKNDPKPENAIVGLIITISTESKIAAGTFRKVKVFSD